MKQFTGYMKGINLGGWLSQCKHSKQHYDTFISEKDIERISSWGLDHIRLPVDYELLETDNGEYIEEGFKYIDDCLEWCKKYGLNMILDLHKTAGYSFDESETSMGFFESEQLQNRFIALWHEFAKRYGKYSDRLTFELLNEIVDKNVTQIWNRIAERAIKTIRQYAPDINILIGGVNNNSISVLKSLDMPYDEHIVYNFHFYEPTVFTHQSAYWVKDMPLDFTMPYPNEFTEVVSKTKEFFPPMHSDIFTDVSLDKMDKSFFEKLFSEAVQIAEERNTSLYCGEYGVIAKADVDSTLNWYSDINSTFEKFGIGRSAWTYKEMDFGIIDEHYAPIFEKLIKLL
ncbi:glycoside hydrolase family 5 protein [Pseudobacteroides cellulosolvens]|uniref:Glycoside hydrolase family 5 n=1 Tax=Pseudobacteroides cellulosolvens ATCC 35603 = DSM 2933 TaxID=398512 RepID=A0A0L6JU40_9FIRM|nr:cellulase family glycosylhydrolase [Pseudobacteroides cellulosolvens]KNY29224.1 glycoside hydrolase family 5 [Pseudobacteroides cellulosolvens ATCC 35603 = DSM 2933]